MRFVLVLLTTLAVVGTSYADDALDAVNAKRAARGLRPYTFDAGLTVAAQGAAQYRASRLMFGHTANDFAFLPSGTPLIHGGGTAAGCAAYPAEYGFMACAIYDNYTYAGAASVPGSDGKMYHHLFVSNTPSTGTPQGAGAIIAAAADSVSAPIPTTPAPAAAPQPTVQYQLQRRGLFGRRTTLVPVTNGACAPAAAATTTLNLSVMTTGSTCAGGSCNLGSTRLRVRIR